MGCGWQFRGAGRRGLRFGFYLLLRSRCRSGVVLRRLSSLNIARVTWTAAISLIPWVALIARTTVTLLTARLVTRIALITTLITLTGLLRRRHRRTRALNFLWWTLEAAKLLTKSLDLALVGGLLALGFFEKFEELVQLIERLAQCGDDLHHFVHGFANGRRLCGLKRAHRQLLRLRRAFLTFLAHRRRTLFALLNNRFGMRLFSLSIGRR